LQFWCRRHNCGANPMSANISLWITPLPLCDYVIYKWRAMLKIILISSLFRQHGIIYPIIFNIFTKIFSGLKLVTYSIYVFCSAGYIWIYSPKKCCYIFMRPKNGMFQHWSFAAHQKLYCCCNDSKIFHQQKLPCNWNHAKLYIADIWYPLKIICINIY